MKTINLQIIDLFFFALTLSLVLPPCFAAPPNELSLEPRISHLVLIAVSMLLLARYAKAFLPQRNKNPAQKAVTTGASLVAFGVLCLSSVLASVLLWKKGNVPPFPLLHGKILLCIITFLTSAFYEETIYRLYLPSILQIALKRSSKMEGTLSTVARTIAEALPLLVFAFSHKYSGMASVFNALAAAAALRICLIKGGSLAACVLVHTSYNTIQLLLGYCLQ